MLRVLSYKWESLRAGRGAELLVCPCPVFGLTDGTTDDVGLSHPEAVSVDFAGEEGGLGSQREMCLEIEPADLPTGCDVDTPQQVIERT